MDIWCSCIYRHRKNLPIKLLPMSFWANCDQKFHGLILVFLINIWRCSDRIINAATFKLLLNWYGCLKKLLLRKCEQSGLGFKRRLLLSQQNCDWFDSAEHTELARRCFQSCAVCYWFNESSFCYEKEPNFDKRISLEKVRMKNRLFLKGHRWTVDFILESILPINLTHNI